MATIGTLAARILADASGITSGLNLTRNELKVTREAFVASRTDAERYQAALDQLNAAKAKGAFAGDEAEYARALQAVNEQLGPAKAALEAQADAMARGKDLTAAMMTAEERRAERLSEVSSLLQQNAISQETYNRAVREMDSEKWQELGTSVRNVAASIGAVSGAVTGALVMAGRDLWNTYSESEDVAAKLQGIMEVNGTAAGGMLAEYTRFANEMQRLTRVEDDAALGMLQVAESLGLTGDAAERAVKNAIALGAATGQDAQAALRMTVGLEHGSTTMITRFIPALKGISDESERVAKAQDILGRMFSVAEAEAKTSGGAYVQLANSVGNLKESFGQFIGEALTPVFGALQAASDAMQNMDAGTRRTIVYVGMAVTGVGALVTVGAGLVAAAGQMVIWYGALTASALGAKAAAIGLTSSIVALQVAAAAAAAGGGYLLGEWLYSLTEDGQTCTRVLNELRDTIAAATDVDLAGSSLSDLENYAEQVAKHIETTKASIAALEEQQGVTNLWQANKDLIGAQQTNLEGLLQTQGRVTKEMQRLHAAAAAETGTTGSSEKDAKAADALLQKFSALRDQLQGELSGESASQRELRAMVDQATKLGILVGDDAAEIENMMQQLAQQKEADALAKSFDDATKRLREEIATAEMGADQAERFKLQQLGLSEAQLQVVENLHQQAAAAKQVAEANKTFAETTAKLQEQIATAGMAADEAERWRLAQKGLSIAQLEVVKSLQLQADAAKLTEQYRSPAEKLATEQQRLKQMLDANLITQGVYDKALEDARKRIEKPITTEYKVEGVGAAIAGSREAAEAIQRHRAQMIDKNAKHVVKFADAAGPLQNVSPPAALSVPEQSPGQLAYQQAQQAFDVQATIDTVQAQQMLELQPNVTSTWQTAALPPPPDLGLTGTAQTPAEVGPAEPPAVEEKFNELLEVFRSLVPIASAIAANTGTPLQVEEVGL